MGCSGTQGLLIFTVNLNSNLTNHTILFAKTDTILLNNRKGTLWLQVYILAVKVSERRGHLHHFLIMVKVKVAQSCLTLCDSMDYTVHGILQARILEWIVFPFSRESSQPRNQTRLSCIAGGFFIDLTIRKAPSYGTREYALYFLV